MAKKPRYNVKIEKWNPHDSVDSDTGTTRFDYWETYVEMEASSFRLDSESDRIGNVPTRYFAVFPTEDLSDFEGSDVALCRIDLHLPHVNLMWLPHLEIVAYVNEMAAVAEPEENQDYGGLSFRPAVDENWEPSMVHIWIKDLVV